MDIVLNCSFVLYTWIELYYFQPTRKLIEEHYEQHINRGFYVRLLEHMISGPVIPMIWEGLDAIKLGRRMLGRSEPLDAMPGTIRADFSIDRERSVIHGSHSSEAAAKEILLWFNENELIEWKSTNRYWINDV